MQRESHGFFPRAGRAYEVTKVVTTAHVDCETYDLPLAREEGGFGRRYHIADLGPFKLLDAVATCDPTGRKVTLAVVNRDRERGHRATIQFVGGSVRSGVEVAEVNGATPEATNSFDHPDAVGVREQRMNLGGSGFEYFPFQKERGQGIGDPAPNGLLCVQTDHPFF